MKQGDIVCRHVYYENGACVYIVTTWNQQYIFGGIVGATEFAYWRIKSLKPTPTKVLLNK